MEQNEKYKDFDQFFAEVEEKKKKMQIKLFGKTYNLPSEIPAETMLLTYRAYKDGLTEMPQGMQMEIAFMVLGIDNVEEWCKLGLTTAQLTEIMLWAAKQQSGTPNLDSVKSKKK